VGHARPPVPLRSLVRRHAAAGLAVALHAAGALPRGHPRDQRVLHQDALPSLSSKLFFDTLWRNTEEGFFADPLYGGNRDKAGWKLLGFPGVGGSEYNDHLDKATPYRVKEPVSIVDIEQLRAKLDPQGYPKHEKLNK